MMEALRASGQTMTAAAPPSPLAPPAPRAPPSCEGCGACCEEAGLPPSYTEPARMDWLPEALRAELASHLAEEAATGFTRNQRGLPCIWHDAATGRCRHYQLRPDVCRDAPVGGTSCMFWLERRRPGPAAGHGDPTREEGE